MGKVIDTVDSGLGYLLITTLLPSGINYITQALHSAHIFQVKGSPVIAHI